MREASVMVGMWVSNGLFGLPLMTLVTRSMSRSARNAFCSCVRASFVSSMLLRFPLYPLVSDAGTQVYLTPVGKSVFHFLW